MGPPSEYQFCDGYYKAEAGFFKLLKVAGGVLSYHNEVRDITRTIQVEYGDFGPAEEGIVQQCGERADLQEQALAKMKASSRAGSLAPMVITNIISQK